MANLYPFIKGLLKWPIPTNVNVSLWNEKCIAFNTFSYRVFVVLYKMLIITGIFNEKANELTIYGMLCWNVTIFYWQELAYLFQVEEKLKACRDSKLNFSLLHVVVFSEYDILHFCTVVCMCQIIFYYLLHIYNVVS